MSRPVVVVTRPQGQQQVLMQLLAQSGIQAHWCPALQVEPLPLDSLSQQRLLDLAQYAAVFFVSTNAARLALDFWQSQHLALPRAWPASTLCLAVADATAAELEKAGLPVRAPVSGFNSEAVLAMPEVAALSGQPVLVCRGEGGREHFAASLQDRGATVDYIPLYRRTCNGNFSWPEDASVVMVTSSESWRCIAAQVPATATVIAGSERIASDIRKQHRGSLVPSASPRDKDMLAALERL